MDLVGEAVQHALLPGSTEQGRGDVGVADLDPGGAGQRGFPVRAHAGSGGRRAAEGAADRKNCSTGLFHRGACNNGPKRRNASADSTVALVLAVIEPFTAPSCS